MKRAKFGNKKIYADGQGFDSLGEFRRWEALRLAAFGRCVLPSFDNAVFGEMLFQDVDQAVIAAYRDERLKAVTGSTVDREMTLISNVFTIARKEWRWPSKCARCNHNPLNSRRQSPRPTFTVWNNSV